MVTTEPRSLQKKPVVKKSKHCPKNGSVAIAITRKYNVARYETVDVHVSVTTSIEEGETQEEATSRVYSQLKIDAEKMCEEVKTMAKAGKL